MKTMKLAGLLMCLLLGACAGQQYRARSSTVDFLYPEKNSVRVKPGTPYLKLPVKVGIAFVPQAGAKRSGFTTWANIPFPSRSDAYHKSATILTPEEKENLLEKVASHFREHDFIDSVEAIPTEYLTEGGSFSNLDQIQTMYGIDIVALVSFDQVQFTDEGFLSLSYFTVVGAYVVSGEKNDTSTLMDTVVYDIKSRKMLFRAPGTSRIKGAATVVNLSEQLRQDSRTGFEKATENMVDRLDRSLEGFRLKVKKEPEAYKVDYSKMPVSYGGGGAIAHDLLFLAVALGALNARKNHALL